MMFYRFHCWEQQDPTYLPSLVAYCFRTGRIAYFESHREITLDITTMALSQYEVEGGVPIIAVAVASEPGRVTLYSPLSDLSEAISASGNPDIQRMLKVLVASLPPGRRLHERG